MEQFHDGHHVRLRSRELGGYLHADEDGDGVSLSDRRASVRAAWAVHLHQGDGDAPYLLLHSAAYGRYLAATDGSAPLGRRGFRVAQRNFEDLEEEAIRWEAIRVATGDHEDDILLRQVDRRFPGLDGRFLRANGRRLRWNKGVSADHFRNICRSPGSGAVMEWVVEPIPSRDTVPRLPPPTGVHLPESLDFLLPSRVIMGSGEGFLANAVSFKFRGRSVYRLWNELISRLGIGPDFSDNVVMYVRAGRYGRLTPLVVDLPRSRQTLVIRAEEPGERP